ncbi:hypothetical protein MELA_02435 [Candidatus Methylomirabilis lanthanidiphila]|uniref:Uncharacterized protein n=1 Tax=Candidatus Methylomirabilis lanthanidiphila TaxID=2211376 RepID=A0A564ZL42_9BACT|nr:hypothetical protein MELA_02435 [Candidatus Methylomirabilis lanthanidiphila]
MGSIYQDSINSIFVSHNLVPGSTAFVSATARADKQISGLLPNGINLVLYAIPLINARYWSGSS